MLWSMKFFGWKLIKALIFGEVWNDSKFNISFGLKAGVSEEFLNWLSLSHSLRAEF